MPPRARIPQPIASPVVRRAVRPFASGFGWIAAMLVVLAAEPEVLKLDLRGGDAAVRLAIVAIAAAFGVMAVRSVVGTVFPSDSAAMSPLRTIATWTGYGLLILLVTSSAGVNLSGFLLGSAVIGVVVGVAAQSSLGNLFAGAVLLIVRPYRLGDWLSLRTAGFGVEYEGEVIAVGAVYTTLDADGRVLRIPNSVAIGSVARVDELPLRAAMDAVVPDTVSPRVLRRSMRDGLGLRDGDRVVVWPMLISSESRTLTCRIEVRARRAVDAGAVADVIRSAAPDAERPLLAAVPSPDRTPAAG
jgi:small-conductance mechanosensitive channel